MLLNSNIIMFFKKNILPPQAPTPPIPAPHGRSRAFLRPLRGIAALPELRQHLALRQQLPHRTGALAVEVPAEPAVTLHRGTERGKVDRSGGNPWEFDPQLSELNIRWYSNLSDISLLSAKGSHLSIVFFFMGNQWRLPSGELT